MRRVGVGDQPDVVSIGVVPPTGPPACSFGTGTISTGTALWRLTASATLPIRARLTPLRPCELMPSLMGFEMGQQSSAPSSEQLAQAWQPYIETCVEAFGPDRGMARLDQSESSPVLRVPNCLSSHP